LIPHGVEIFVGLEPIDLRWTFDRLAGIVTERVGRDVRSGAMFVFFGKRHDAIKVVLFDSSGLVVVRYLPPVDLRHKPFGLALFVALVASAPAWASDGIDNRPPPCRSLA
jgi:hypothetical protein